MPQDGLLARMVINVPLALWRDSRGELQALTDRCCHRSAPLSMGRIEGDCVRCAYRGLKFDASGRCVQLEGTASWQLAVGS